MMDKQLEMSDSQAVTVTAISTNVIDTLPSSFAQTAVANLGGPGALYWVFQVDTAADAVGAATVAVTLESDSTADLATSATVHATLAAIPKATLIAGYTVITPLPIGNYERYLGTRYTVATGPLTAGAFSSYLRNDLSNWKPYPTASAPNL